MKKAMLITISLSAVLSLLLASSASANFMPPIPDLPHICIKSNGAVEPSNAPIQKLGNVYSLTRDLIKENVIEVQTNNAVLDGGGHTIQGMAPSGIIVYGRNNVTIKNFTVKQFNSGISIRYSCNVIVTGNNLSGNDNGVVLDYAINNTVVENVMNGNGDGILTFNNCDYNQIVRNEFLQNKYAGIWFEGSQDGSCDYNSIVQNTISSNTQEGIMCRSLANSIFAANTFENNGYGSPDTVEGYGIFLSASDNKFFYNNFVNNREQALDLGNNNAWDNGAKGNYWSNYTGTDGDSDGAGDSPFLIERSSADSLPLIEPVNILEVELPPLPIASSISIPTPPEPTPSPSGNPSLTPEPDSSPSPSPSPNPILGPTGQFDPNAEFKSGMVPGENVKFWYVWVNSSDTQVIYYAMLSDVYNPPIISFLGQHFQTENGTDVFVGNTKALIEVYDDKNGDGIPQADFTTGQSEILYHLVVNSSVSYEVKPLEKTVEDGVPHYKWGITYKTIDGFLFRTDMSGFAFKAEIGYLQFEYDFYIMQNASYTKTGFSMSDLTIDPSDASSPVSLEGLSLSLLYITSTSSPKPYTTYVNGKPYNSATVTEAATATPSGQIIVDNIKAYEFLFDENYTLTVGETEQSYEVKSAAAATPSVPLYLTGIRWVFSDLENVLNMNSLFPSVLSTDGRLNLDYGASNFLYRICYPAWEGAAIEHDPTGVAYFQATETVPNPSDGESNDDYPFPTTWILTLLLSGVVAAGFLFYFKKRGSKGSMKKTASALTIILALLVLTSAGLQFVRLSSANFFPIPVPSPAYIIKSDGSVDPSLAPIQRSGNTYTLTSDIVGYTIAVERDDVVLDGAGYTLTGVGSSTGIFVKNSHGVTIRNMIVANFAYGIRFFAEDFMSETSSDNALIGNTLENNEYGIYLSASLNNVLKNNQMNNNKNNFWIRGGYISETENGYTNDVDTSNTINGKPIIYWINQSDKTVPSDAGFVSLVDCNRIIVQDLTLANNGDGILLVSTANSQLLRNHVAECGTGIYLYASQYNEVKENTLEKNSEGIRTEVASDNNIAFNEIIENGIGIYSSSSNNNMFTGNSITRNTEDGLNLQGVQNSTIRKNRIAENNQTGINIFDSRDNEISSNVITGTIGNGIKFWYQSTGNKVLQNQIAANGIGLLIADSYENGIIGNNLTENRDWGLRLEGDQNNNIIYQNNFSGDAAKGLPVSIPGVWYEENRPGGGNVWDNGTTGNYWSDYTKRYANASEIGSSGIWNTPYYINENNMDRYPLVKPFEASGADGGVPDGKETYDWTMFKANAERNGFTDSPAPENNQVFWKFQTAGAIVSSPAVADGIVFVSSTDGYLYAVNAESGSKRWSVQLGSGISSPAVASGKVFVTCKPGELVALDMYSGTQVWRQPLGEEAGFGSPLVVGYRVFANGNQTVHVFNTEVGANLYNVDVNTRGAGGIAPLAYDADLILALMGTGSEFGCNGFEAADGMGRFWITIGPSTVDVIKSGPAVSEGRTYAVSVNPEGYSTVYALEAFGMRAWEQPLDGITEASPAVAYDLVYIPTDKNAYALNATDGSVEWSFPVNGEGSISSPAVADGKVFFGLDNGYIYALDAHTGSLIWDCKTGGAVQSSPAISNGLLFVGSDDGYLYAVGRQSNVASDNPPYLIIVTVSIAFAVGVGLLVYFKKARTTPH